VGTGIARFSPEAVDFTLKVRIGWIAPEAVAVTTMSRRVTGTSEYGGADCTFWHAATPASTTALTTLRCRLTAGLVCPSLRREWLASVAGAARATRRRSRSGSADGTAVWPAPATRWAARARCPAPSGRRP